MVHDMFLLKVIESKKKIHDARRLLLSNSYYMPVRDVIARGAARGPSAITSRAGIS